MEDMYPAPKQYLVEPMKPTLTLADQEILEAIQRELLRARAKFPANNHMLAALQEENGELANALIEHANGKRTAMAVYAEAVQVAAMAIRVATEGDASFPYVGSQHGGPA